ncbi:hypothetical protein A3B42_00880 [Candidatus Daviesbacteria bacterium RIFCSPLOWO2_01_FULL_38_10]|nr:MAG: PilT protein domain protein [Candidatus Daviesbacteria bacterium GW2011_GWA2_38_17]OGE26059.1 MAG: hypothetical protein A3D02_03455 [Candidatus Daviesbacteria bacterium RIFCSPHIGHO2_02_FULL_39_41]OGE38318.1 MAG: hypothetical protein A3B42_00880 [Candidatus Daviesbacteria bacterium RIFCSPLOWO2_01_FULL_38_10]OGE44871.1 MAG: hypothetical protein A3E67_00485 [Candidatus Daviesbacteria bacterium RIFCSPHIGHO2_12_FULL_38_25]OGE68078.1 MAG: hypothetical protein A3H81_03725 [Candidatus Daviesbac
MTSFLVDANAFLRFFLNDIPKQKKEFERLLKKAEKSKVLLIVPQIIIFEIDFALRKYYRFSKEEVVDKLQTIVETPFLEIEDSLIFREAIQIYSGNNLSLTDCFLYVKAKEENRQLFTFDKALKNLQKLIK